MTETPSAIWSPVRLVVFDLDGTLYEQAPVRRGMALRLLRHSVVSRSFRDARTLGSYRRLRERMGEEAPVAFGAVLREQAARVSGRSHADIDAMVSDWIETRPLPLLRAARVRGAATLFDALRRRGIMVAVWSDYPVHEKLRALGLRADIERSAADPDLDCLKPRPDGLLDIMRRAGVMPAETLMIGDRADRDGAAARAAGVTALLRSRRPVPGFSCFRHFEEPLFAPVLAS